VILFSLHLSEKFLILRRIQQDMIIKIHIGLYGKYPYSCSILITVEDSGHIFEKYTYIKFHEDLSSGSRVVPCGQTDIQTNTAKVIVAFGSFANAPQNRARIKPKIQKTKQCSLLITTTTTTTAATTTAYLFECPIKSYFYFLLLLFPLKYLFLIDCLSNAISNINKITLYKVTNECLFQRFKAEGEIVPLLAMKA
jgi:hypothetical protein